MNMDSSIHFLGEEVVTDSSLLSKPEDVHGNEKCKPKNKKEKKLKTKVHDKKDKRERGANAEKTKSKGFRRRFLSLFCCCFKSQERNDKNGEMEQSTEKGTSHVEKNTSQGSFVTVDLND